LVVGGLHTSAVRLLSPAPAAAAHDLPPFVHDEVGAVVDELHIGPADVIDRAGDLSPVVNAGAELAQGFAHDECDRVDVVARCGTDFESHR
jgi:hypothetical protein